MFLIDDSSSMYGPRWRETKDAIEKIAPICTKYDSDGIDIHFLNHPTPYKNITSEAQVSAIFNRIEPNGMTFTGKRLRQLITPYLARVEKNVENTKPLNIIVITDGEPTDEPHLVIIPIAKKLDKMDALPWQLGIQFLQVGNDPKAAAHLRFLDDKLSSHAGDENMRDIVDTQPYRSDHNKPLSADGILKVVLGAVLKRMDEQHGNHLHL